MTKSELIIRLSKLHPDLTPKQVEAAVNVVFDSISSALRKDLRVELRGFGAFSTRKRAPRMARNHKTGEQVKLEERSTIYFRAGKKLRERVNK